MSHQPALFSWTLPCVSCDRLEETLVAIVGPGKPARLGAVQLVPAGNMDDSTERRKALIEVVARRDGSQTRVTLATGSTGDHGRSATDHWTKWLPVDLHVAPDAVVEPGDVITIEVVPLGEGVRVPKFLVSGFAKEAA